jgi:hypothetical protein
MAKRSSKRITKKDRKFKKNKKNLKQTRRHRVLRKKHKKIYFGGEDDDIFLKGVDEFLRRRNLEKVEKMNTFLNSDDLSLTDKGRALKSKIKIEIKGLANSITAKESIAEQFATIMNKDTKTPYLQEQQKNRYLQEQQQKRDDYKKEQEIEIATRYLREIVSPENYKK